MTLEPDTTLGPYSVTAKIGEGGMGEVWQARDTKLDRDVALKVLPPAFTDDSDRLARFEREAKVLASLNHPNIGGIHGLEESEGVKALVLEYVKGPALADRIKRGPIPIDEALPIARQIAEALEAAHEQGILHRDLKSANVKVRDDGTVKVLDFGLAKALKRDIGLDSSESPTLTAGATRQGVIIGTAAYMSPEQARGQPADKRADIWAFGAVFFEMLTGQRAFGGQDVTETLAEVIKSTPDWQVLPHGSSPTVATYLRQCLVKEPRQRIHDIADVRLAIEGAFEPPESTVNVVDAGVFRGGQLNLRALDQFRGGVIRGAEGGRQPFVSPDGQWVGFTNGDDRQLYRVPIDGGRLPVWAPGGGELFYVEGARMMAVPVQTTPTFTPGAPTPLFEGDYYLAAFGRSFDVARDGRFLMVKDNEQGTARSGAEIRAVLNWFQELRERVLTN